MCVLCHETCTSRGDCDHLVFLKFSVFSFALQSIIWFKMFMMLLLKMLLMLLLMLCTNQAHPIILQTEEITIHNFERSIFTFSFNQKENCIQLTHKNKTYPSFLCDADIVTALRCEFVDVFYFKFWYLYIQTLTRTVVFISHRHFKALKCNCRNLCDIWDHFHISLASIQNSKLNKPLKWKQPIDSRSCPFVGWITSNILPVQAMTSIFTQISHMCTI